MNELHAPSSTILYFKRFLITWQNKKIISSSWYCSLSHGLCDKDFHFLVHLSFYFLFQSPPNRRTINIDQESIPFSESPH